MKVLEGITVVDFTQAYSGPFAAMNLADFGARIVKIERPGYGDNSRAWAPFAENGESGYFSAINRGKESMTLDIGQPEGLEAAKRWIAKADVLLENFKVGTLDKKGLSYEEVKKINPEIIYASISGYGQVSPWSRLAAYDNVVQAQCGIMDMTGYADEIPTKVGVSIGDNYTGLEMALAISMALFHRMRTGKGQKIDIAMYDTLFGILERPILQKTVAGKTIHRSGNTTNMVYPYSMFHCKDGLFTVGVENGTPEEWTAFCKAIGREDLLAEEKYMDNEARVADGADLDARIAPFFADRTCEELTAIFEAADIACSPVKGIPELATDPQLEARGMLNPMIDTAVGPYKATGNPIHMEKTPAVYEKCAPLLGEDTEALLKEIGYDDADIAAFREKGVI